MSKTISTADEIKEVFKNTNLNTETALELKEIFKNIIMDKERNLTD